MGIGRATRLMRFVESEAKTYRATVRFGTATDTDDGTGQVVAEGPVPDSLSAELLATELAAMEGTHLQRPPAYSAKHVAGRRSHQLARAGEAVELAPVEVTMHALRLLSWQGDQLVIEAQVGKGTYLRALARDLGMRVGVPAHCSDLRRTSIGRFSAADAVAPEAVEVTHLLSAGELVAHLGRQELSDDELIHVSHGRRIECRTDGAGPIGLMAEDGRLVAIGEAADGHWHPSVVLEPAA